MNRSRTRFSRYISICTLAFALMLVASSSAWATVAGSSSPLLGTTSKFEGGDADSNADTTTAQEPNGVGNYDWSSFGSLPLVTFPDPQFDNPATTDTVEGDSSFIGGNKETAPDAWGFTPQLGGVNPGKDNVFAAWMVPDNQPANNKAFLNLSFHRQSPTGDTFLTFELNQLALNWTNSIGTSIPCRVGAALQNGDPDPSTTHDILISYEVTPGGQTPVDIKIYQWTSLTVAHVDPTDGHVLTQDEFNNGDPFVDCGRTGRLDDLSDTNPDLVNPSTAQAAVNFHKAVDPNHLDEVFPETVDGLSQPATFDKGTFGEASIDLTALLQPPSGTCFGFGQAQVHSRSSVAIDSQLQDSLAPEPIISGTCGKVIIKKIVHGGSGSESFTFTPSSTLVSGSQDQTPHAISGGTWSMGDGGQEDFTEVTPNSSGTYTVAETANSDFTTTGSCDDGDSSFASGSFTIKVGASETVTCTFTNTRKTGTLQLKKIITSTTGDTSGSFDVSATADGASDAAVSGTLGNGDTTDAVTVDTGSYDLAEAAAQGTDATDYSRVSLECVNKDTDAVIASTGDAVNVADGVNVLCTFTNRHHAGTLELRKVIVGAAGDNEFRVTIDDVASKGGISQASSADDSTTGVQNVNTGDYTLREAADNSTTDLGDYQSSLSCTKPNGEDGTTDVPVAGDNPASVHVGDGDAITCTYTNTLKELSVHIDKTGPDLAHDGDKITYTIVVTNPGTTTLHNVTVGDQIKGQTHGCDAGGGPTLISGDKNSDGLLQTTETWTYSCTYTVQHGDEDANHIIDNIASVTATDNSGHHVGPITDDAPTKVIHPAIKIDKTGPATGEAGQAISYALTVTNPGDTPLGDPSVKVSDEQCNGSPVALQTKNGDKSEGTLDPGDTWSYTCTVQTAVGDTAVHNVATVTGCDQLGGCVNSQASADTTLTQPVQLLLPERVTPGAARLAGPTGCVAKAFNARVRGSKIATVTFVLDGKVIKKVKNTKNAALVQLRVNPARLKIGVHRLVVTVTFQSGSGTKPKTMRLSFQRCAKKLVAPRFTG